jgi:hypothetical protein
MSDSPNSTPPSNNPNRNPGDANGFNWRLLGLLSVGTIILGAAFLSPMSNKVVKTMTYAQFSEALEQGRVVSAGKDQGLRIVTTDTSYDATIEGFVLPTAQPLKEDLPRKDFQVPVNLTLQREEINALLGNDIRFEQIQPADRPKAEDVEVISLAALRTSLASNWVDRESEGNKLRILTTPGSDDAVIVGTRIEAPPVVQQIDPKTGKVEGAVPFRVAVSTAIQGKDLEKLVQEKKAGYVRNKDYLSTALFTFLPFLLIIGAKASAVNL